MSPLAPTAYTGRDNLEVMAEAVRYNRWLVATARAAMPTQGRILDFGAGTGTLTTMLRATGLDVLAVEADEQLAEQLAARGIVVFRDLEGIEDGTLAGVVSFNVLEHIEDDAAILRALWNKLAPGGRLFVYVPAFPVLYSSMDRKVGHVRRYRRRPLGDLLTASGFRVEECRYADSLGFFASLIYKMLADDTGELNARAVRLYDRCAFPVSRLLDQVCAGSFGKNLLAVAHKPST